MNPTLPPVKLVLVPGLDGSGVMFRPLLAELPAWIEPMVVRYPQDRPLGCRELRDMISLPASPYYLLAESFGGPLALMLAAARPPLLRGLILSASFVRNPVRFRPSWLRHLARPVGFQLYPLFKRARLLFGGHYGTELAQLSLEALSQARPDVMAGRVRETLVVDVRQELIDCAVPILYLIATRDRVVWKHNLREMLEMNPSIDVRRFDAPHWLLQTSAPAAAREIEAFIIRTMPGDK